MRDKAYRPYMRCAPIVPILCYAVSAAALIGSVMYTIYGEHTWIGILGVLIAAVLSRVLILNVVYKKS